MNQLALETSCPTWNRAPTESALEVVSTAGGHTAHLTHHASNTQIAVAWVFHDSSDLTKTGMKEEKKNEVKVAAGNDV